MDLLKLPQYELLQRETIEDIHSEGYLLCHKKSGARVMILENEDQNKVFNIAFRTRPSDSTGVAHIIEHSVLCGSKNFPAKDPFVELVKGSLNTFLNAMTYPDKTMYPIASCNEKDFCNLMHVYLDAVFYPNIYKREEIFRQEGWTYDLEHADDELTYNGVVYNEMKGAFSSAEDVLDREILNSLFPDTTYGVESGGDPKCIPELTYEQFLDFHRTFYHPSNSYIYLYGDMDAVERLTWIDEQYLCHFDKKEIDSEIQVQPAFETVKEVKKTYPISEEEPLEDNTYLSYNVVVGTSQDVELANAFAVLEYAILSAPGAELKQALLDAEIGKDIMSSYDSGVCQPYFSVVAKNANTEDKERFVSLIREKLAEIADCGIDQAALFAGINSMEFRFREADYGQYPKGLMYGIEVFDSWLYQDDAAFSYLKQLDVYDHLKELVGTGYFEELIRKYLLDNQHASIVVVEPERGLTAKEEQELKDRLAAYKNSLSQEEVEKLVQRTKELKEYQDAPSTPEELDAIPMLSIEDIGKEAAPFQNTPYKVQDVTLLHHDIYTNGIAYLTFLFDTKRIPKEKLGYLGILKNVIGMVDTTDHKYQDLNNEINMYTGGITPGVSVFPLIKEQNSILSFFGVKVRVLYDKLDYAFDAVYEMVCKSLFTNEKRLHEILSKIKSRLYMQLTSSGHATAAGRALSYLSQMNMFNDVIGGISFYEMVKDLEEHFDEKKDELKKELQEIAKALFHKDGLFLSLTSDQKGLELVKPLADAFLEKLPSSDAAITDQTLDLVKKNEGFMTPGQVLYVARTGNYKKDGHEYTGALRILKVMMSYDYLWLNVRVKGGAYGCMSSFGRDGSSYFVSYRDPNLKETNAVYEGIPEYLENIDIDDHEMTKYIIGTISELDTPMNPSAKGSRSLSAYFTQLTFEDIQRDRDEVLGANAETIRALAPLMRSILADEAVCVIGNEDKIRHEESMFKTIKHLS